MLSYAYKVSLPLSSGESVDLFVDEEDFTGEVNLFKVKVSPGPRIHTHVKKVLGSGDHPDPESAWDELESIRDRFLTKKYKLRKSQYLFSASMVETPEGREVVWHSVIQVDRISKRQKVIALEIEKKRMTGLDRSK
jgi:hypothetical protein